MLVTLPPHKQHSPIGCVAKAKEISHEQPVTSCGRKYAKVSYLSVLVVLIAILVLMLADLVTNGLANSSLAGTAQIFLKVCCPQMILSSTASTIQSVLRL